MKHLIMFTEHGFLMFIVSTFCLICIQVLMGLWLCALFCPQRMWGFDPAIYISFFFSLYDSISACLNTYSMRYILACWISWSWKCCMECYNKVIFFYKLQLKWFVLFFYGYLMMYNRRCASIATTVCNQVCVIISVRFCGLCWPFCAHTLYCYYCLMEQ